MEKLDQILEIIIQIILIVGSVISINYLIKYLGSKILIHDEKVAKKKLENLESAIVQLEETVAIAVRSLNQTKVNKLKEKNKFTKKQAKTVLNEAITKVKQNMNKKAMHRIDIFTECTDCLIEDMIEATLDEMKNNG